MEDREVRQARINVDDEFVCGTLLHSHICVPLDVLHGHLTIVLLHHGRQIFLHRQFLDVSCRIGAAFLLEVLEELTIWLQSQQDVFNLLRREPLEVIELLLLFLDCVSDSR